MVVVNLYPFKHTVALPGVTPEQAVEAIMAKLVERHII